MRRILLYGFFIFVFSIGTGFYYASLWKKQNMPDAAKIIQENNAENYVRFHQGQKSAARLKMDLMRKGVSKDLIEQALSQEYQSDERKMIEQILQKKGYFSGEKLPAEQRRMYGYLLRRGYKSSDILHVMKCDDYLT